MSRRPSLVEPKEIRVDARQFEAIVRAHEAFASGRPGGMRAVPRFIIAHRMRCDRRLLRDADFTGADLTGCTFVGTDLSRASLYCAVLTRCDLRGARLPRADLRGATFSGAKLAGANLDEADMRAAILCAVDAEKGLRRIGAGVRLDGARLDGVNLEDAVAFNVDFSNCSLRGARLRNANLKNANFTDANLAGVDFTGARIGGVTFTGAILTGVDLASLFLTPDQLRTCVVDPTAEARARGADILRALDKAERWIATAGREGERARLDGLDLRPAGTAFQKRLLGGLSARNVQAIGLDFSGVQAQGAIFDGADLRTANFTGADLRGASFIGAKLSHVLLQDADTGPLPMPGGGSRRTRFDRASLHGTGLSHLASAPPAGKVAAA
jgi:uncharacterized protein YjbI with pentapeptide repeats